MKIEDFGCEWFAKCDNHADGVVEHPILGMVPTCQRCADKLDLNLLEVDLVES